MISIVGGCNLCGSFKEEFGEFVVNVPDRPDRVGEYLGRSTESVLGVLSVMGLIGVFGDRESMSSIAMRGDTEGDRAASGMETKWEER